MVKIGAGPRAAAAHINFSIDLSSSYPCVCLRLDYLMPVCPNVLLLTRLRRSLRIVHSGYTGKPPPYRDRRPKQRGD